MRKLMLFLNVLVLVILCYALYEPAEVETIHYLFLISLTLLGANLCGFRWNRED